MKNYIVKALIEVEADSKDEAEDLVLGLDITDDLGHSLPSYVQIEEVEEVNG